MSWLCCPGESYSTLSFYFLLFLFSFQFASGTTRKKNEDLSFSLSTFHLRPNTSRSHTRAGFYRNFTPLSRLITSLSTVLHASPDPSPSHSNRFHPLNTFPPSQSLHPRTCANAAIGRGSAYFLHIFHLPGHGGAQPQGTSWMS